jgi:alpha-L-fucosidase
LIPPPSVNILEETGKWLNINGEAIYATNSLRQFKEGDHIRFTASKDAAFIFAILTKKEGNEVRLTTIQPASNSNIYMLGLNDPLPWRKEGEAIVVKLPEQLPCEHAWVLKIKK